MVPVAALVASHIVFSQVFPGQPGYQFPWAYFLTVATVMLSCWEVNLVIFRWLDNHLPFWQNPVLRLVAQVLMGGTATLLTFAFVFPLSQRMYTGHWPTEHTVLKGIVVCITLATIVNGGYSGLYLLQAFIAEQRKKDQYTISENMPHQANSPSQLLVSIEISNGQLRLPTDDIAYFYSTGGLVLLVKTDGQQLTTRYTSFSSLIPVLSTDQFFQLSRQFVISKAAVRAVQDAVNRKLTVSLVPALHRQVAMEEVIVSRYRSAEFKQWLEANNTL
jgi:hypothetical protein